MKTPRPNRDELRAFERLAESYVKQAGVTRPPVNPLEWCQDPEEIRVYESGLRGECDGLLVFRKGKFHLFYRPDPSRMRFTQAHEVAHYLIEEHHMSIRSGAAEHVCKTGFVTDSAMEREADSFAAGLLMPAFLFQPRCPDPNFAAIGRVAHEFDVSLTAAILRTITFTPLHAAVVVTVAGSIKWYFPSEEMAYSGVHTAKVGEPPPRNSKTAEVCAKLHSFPSEPVEGRKCFASQWFHNAHNDPELWEEVLPLPSYNQVFSLLVHDE